MSGEPELTAESLPLSPDEERLGIETVLAVFYDRAVTVHVRGRDGALGVTSSIVRKPGLAGVNGAVAFCRERATIHMLRDWERRQLWQQAKRGRQETPQPAGQEAA